MIKNFKFLVLFLLLPISNIFAQDEFTGPSEFEYNQSRFQAFYLFIDGYVDSSSLEEGDWVAAYNGDVCIGSQAWAGAYTALPVMGNDGSIWTEGYLDLGILKDKNHEKREFYGTGIKLNLLPDFFELYFPISSSNGYVSDELAT